MTKDDKELLLQMVARIGMFIHPLEADSAINFIHGYETGTRDQCDFTKQLRQLLSDKYKLAYSNDGWPGQIRSLAKKRSSTWLIIFRRLTLETIATEEGGSLDESQQAILKTRILSLIEKKSTPPPQLSPGWVEDWLSLCAVKSGWFKQLWTSKEWTVIRAIDKLVQAEGRIIAGGQLA
jgi:hypothetical protein